MAQKYSAIKGSGSRRHLPQTGTRVASLRDSPQTRQSSGQTRPTKLSRRPQRPFPATRSNVLETQLLSSALPSSLLEKTHLRLTVSVYNRVMLWIRALVVWLLTIAAETVHGILRNLFLVPVVGDFHSLDQH